MECQALDTTYAASRDCVNLPLSMIPQYPAKVCDEKALQWSKMISYQAALSMLQWEAPDPSIRPVTLLQQMQLGAAFALHGWIQTAKLPAMSCCVCRTALHVACLQSEVTCSGEPSGQCISKRCHLLIGRGRMGDDDGQGFPPLF